MSAATNLARQLWALGSRIRRYEDADCAVGNFLPISRRCWATYVKMSQVLDKKVVNWPTNQWWNSGSHDWNRQGPCARPSVLKVALLFVIFKGQTGWAGKMRQFVIHDSDSATVHGGIWCSLQSKPLGTVVSVWVIVSCKVAKILRQGELCNLYDMNAPSKSWELNAGNWTKKDHNSCALE